MVRSQGHSGLLRILEVKLILQFPGHQSHQCHIFLALVFARRVDVGDDRGMIVVIIGSIELVDVEVKV